MGICVALITLAMAMIDDEFDEVFEEPWRERWAYWSPVTVAQLAASWLTETGVDTVLDVGSGLGKFCLVGALRTAATFVGIEHRLPLVVAARRAARTLGLAARVHFIHGEASAGFLAQFRALYMFNPFGENLYEHSHRLDSSVELGTERHARDIALVEDALYRLPQGARVATYHGFGGHIPDNFEVVRDSILGSDRVRVWAKARRAANGHFIETREGIAHVPASAGVDLPSE